MRVVFRCVACHGTVTPHLCTNRVVSLSGLPVNTRQRSHCRVAAEGRGRLLRWWRKKNNSVLKWWERFRGGGALLHPLRGFTHEALLRFVTPPITSCIVIFCHIDFTLQCTWGGFAVKGDCYKAVSFPLRAGQRLTSWFVPQ